MKHTFIPTIRPTDWLAGDGNIPFKAAVPTGDWSKYIEYFERQKFTYDSAVSRNL